MKSRQINQHFDQIAPKYDQYKKRNYLYYQTLKKAVKKLVKGKNLRVLDIGCGTGEILNYLRPQYGIGVDISRKMIDLAIQKYGNNKSLSFYTHNIEKSPITGNFDFIIFTDVIEHLANKEKAIKNISRTMNKKTKLILSMANPLWEPLLLVLEKLKLKMPEGPHQRISEKELAVLLANYNLKICSKYVFLPKIKFLGLIFIYVIKKSR